LKLYDLGRPYESHFFIFFLTPGEQRFLGNPSFLEFSSFSLFLFCLKLGFLVEFRLRVVFLCGQRCSCVECDLGVLDLCCTVDAIVGVFDERS